MLEGLISSRIRRTLLEHLLQHPSERFYLRGLAKELQLSVSPLRRELKRLEARGLLRAYHEGNLLFYVVNQTSPAFLQLQHAVSDGGVQPAPAAMPVTAPIRVAVEQSRARWAWPPALALASVGVMIVGLIGVALYVTKTNPRSLSVTVIHTEPSTTGEMRGSRWRLLPGSMGGFAAPSREENY